MLKFTILVDSNFVHFLLQEDIKMLFGAAFNPAN